MAHVLTLLEPSSRERAREAGTGHAAAWWQQRPGCMGRREGLWAAKLYLSITSLCPNLNTASPCPYLSIASDSLTIWAMSLLWIFCCTSSSWALVHLGKGSSDRAPRQRP